MIQTTQRTFNECFQVCRDLSVDECMVAFKGRLSFKQYMPAKPTKWGIKIWSVCDARLGYCVGYDVYTGKASRKNPRKPLGFEVVDSLCSPHFGKGHHVYVDRFFNSVDLAEHLSENGTYLCGTIMSNRKGLPPATKRKMKTKGELMQLQKGNLVTTAFHDKRTVHLLSTNQIMGTAEDGRPLVLSDYNKYMGGVDKLDQQLSYYPVGRPGKKWWRYIVWHIINTAVYNAFIIWNKSAHNFPILKTYDHMMFRCDIADGLINGFCSRKLPGRKATRLQAIPEGTIKHHVISKIAGRKRSCVLCSLEKRKTPKGYPIETSFICKFCDVPLCKKLCFSKYHELGMNINEYCG